MASTNDNHLFTDTEQPSSSNSFIANVNKLANNFEKMNYLLEVPAEVEGIKDETQSILDEANGVLESTRDVFKKTVTQSNKILLDVQNVQEEVNKTYSDTILVKEIAASEADEARRLKERTEAIRDEAVAITDKNIKVSESLKNETEKIKEEVNTISELTSFTENIEILYTSEEGINAGDIVEFEGLMYFVGRNTLCLNWEGAVLFKGIHYEEVGEENRVSKFIKFLIDIPAGDRINIWAVSSNIARDIKDKLEEARELDTSTKENADRAEEAAQKAKEAWLKAKDSIKFHKCHLPFVSLEDPDHNKVPPIDSFFVYTFDLPCLVEPEEPEIPDEGIPEEGTPEYKVFRICGQRVSLLSLMKRRLEKRDINA